MKREKIRFRTIIVIILLMPLTQFAQQRLTVTCNEPKGNRIDYVSEAFEESQDKFSGVKPIFIYDNKNPDKLIFIWGATKIVPDELFPDEAEDATIVSYSEDRITAIYTEPGEAVLLFSLFPKEGVVYFTQHRYIFFSIPNTSSFYCKCNFKYSDK
jgi:hypothetical protein